MQGTPCDADFPMDPTDSVSAVATAKPTIDLGNLMAFVPLQFRTSQGQTSLSSDTIMLHATEAMQELLSSLFTLPSVPDKMGRIATLPKPTTLLPREKLLPKPRIPTKWEKFAQSKGIVKRKRSKLEFDEASGEWRRRHGYKRVRDEEDVPVIEASPNDTGEEDPFASKRKEKTKRVAKQEKNRMQNLHRQAKAGGSASLPSSVQMSAKALPLFDAPPIGGRSGTEKTDVKQTAAFAQTATASGGKFDKKLPGENLNVGGKRRKFLPVAGSGKGGKERDVAKNIMEKIIAKNDFDVLDVNKAVTTHRQTEEKARSENKREEKTRIKTPKKIKGGKGQKR